MKIAITDCRSPGHVFACPWVGETFAGSTGWGQGLVNAIIIDDSAHIDNGKGGTFAIATKNNNGNWIVE